MKMLHLIDVFVVLTLCFSLGAMANHLPDGQKGWAWGGAVLLVLHLVLDMLIYPGGNG